nr:YraN family protein [uncultured Deefgea sp.]
MNGLGAAAEQRAADFIVAQGLKLIARNWRCRFGEIDLIAKDAKTLVFIEVRARTNANFGGAASSIQRSKQEKLIRTAQMYLQALSPLPPCRFDAICIDGDDLVWLKDCIQAK